MKYIKKNAKAYHEHKGFYFSSINTHEYRKNIPAAVSPVEFSDAHHSKKALDEEHDFLEGILVPYFSVPEEDE